jgi:aminocarboxymuconate-semialdehyde decarboxylase
MIDIYAHILPINYKNALDRKARSDYYLRGVDDAVPTLWDLDRWFGIVDEFDGLRQVLTLASPPIESVVGDKEAVELAKLANDEMAELVAKYPRRFVAAVACLPMNDIDAALKELDRAITQLNFKGVQIYTPTNDKPIDQKEFLPLYDKMSQYDLPIWIHPQRDRSFSDYRSEDHSKYWIFSMFGWPYETTSAMTRLVFSGIMEKYPNLKIITHHCGGMLPYFADRMAGGQDFADVCLGAKFKKHLNKPPIEYFRRFYGDTALYGAPNSLMCGYAFFGSEHMLFGTDMPYDCECGARYLRLTIDAINTITIPEDHKKMIFEGNAKRLLHL